MKKLLNRFWNHMTKLSTVIWSFFYSVLTYFISMPSTKYLSFIFLTLSVIFLIGLIYKRGTKEKA